MPVAASSKRHFIHGLLWDRIERQPAMALHADFVGPVPHARELAGLQRRVLPAPGILALVPFVRQPPVLHRAGRLHAVVLPRLGGLREGRSNPCGHRKAHGDTSFNKGVVPIRGSDCCEACGLTAKLGVDVTV